MHGVRLALYIFFVCLYSWAGDSWVVETNSRCRFSGGPHSEQSVTVSVFILLCVAIHALCCTHSESSGYHNSSQSQHSLSHHSGLQSRYVIILQVKANEDVISQADILECTILLACETNEDAIVYVKGSA